METDLEMPHDIKTKHMEDWWEGNLKIFANMRLEVQDYGRVVLESRLLFRHGIAELLRLSKELKLPFYIVSGGITEIIEATFYAIMHNGEISSEEEMHSYWQSHMQVVSN